MSQSDGGQASSLAADLAAAESSLKAEQERLRRTRKLYQIQGVSLEQLQSAEASFAAVRARLVRLARENLRNATVTAPFAGVVSQRFVQAGDLATPGKPLLKIIDTTLGQPPAGHRAGRPCRPTGAARREPELPLQPWPEAARKGCAVTKRVPRRRLRSRHAGGRPDGVFQSAQAMLLPRTCLFNSDGQYRHGAAAAMTRTRRWIRCASRSARKGRRAPPRWTRGSTSQRVACASADILTRLAAGVSFQVQGGRGKR